MWVPHQILKGCNEAGVLIVAENYHGGGAVMVELSSDRIVGLLKNS
jgi:hypothetical protein